MSIFSDINKVQILGNVTQKPEIKSTKGGTAVTQISVATSRSYKVKDSDEWKKEPEFHSVVLWGKMAEMAGERFEKGTRILVEGRLATRSWEKDGVKHYKTEVIATDVILIARYNKRSGEEAPLPDEPPVEAQGGDVVIDPDDLPF